MKRRFLQVGLMLLAAAFVLLGLARGEAETVLRKAAMLCLECVGIG